MIRSADLPAARRVTMTPNTFPIHDGVGDVGARPGRLASWEEEPDVLFPGTARDGDLAVELARTRALEGTPAVVRQTRVIRVGPDEIRERRLLCCGPRRVEHTDRVLAGLRDGQVVR